MPVTPTYPGVYIEEVPSGVRTIMGVSTSISAFIDNFRRGPLNEAVELLSYADFERESGGLEATSQASYAIKQFFLNGGQRAFAVRVGHDDNANGNPFSAASATLAGAAGNLLTATAGVRLRGASVENPGEWGNRLRIDVDYDTRVPSESLDPDRVQTTCELFNLYATETEVREDRAVVVRTEAYPNITLRPGARNNAVETVNERSKLIQLAAAVAQSPANRPFTTGTLGSVLPTPFVAPADHVGFSITVDPDGTGGAPVTQNATLEYGGNTPTSYAQLRAFVEQAIRRAAPATQPEGSLFSAATVQLLDERNPNGTLSDQRFRVLLGRTGPGYNPAATVVLAAGAPTPLDTLESASATVAPQQIALNAGADGVLVTAAELQGSRNGKTGIYALEDVDLFNILCIPAAANLPDAEMRAVYSEAEVYCEEKRAFLIVDLGDGADDLEGVQQWLSDNETLRHRNAAVYFPRLEVADPLGDYRLRGIGSSGTVAGLYARTDGTRGVWKAPAGPKLRWLACRR